MRLSNNTRITHSRVCPHSLNAQGQLRYSQLLLPPRSVHRIYGLSQSRQVGSVYARSSQEGKTGLALFLSIHGPLRGRVLVRFVLPS